MKVFLFCHGSTDAVRSARFPRDEPLDALGLAQTGRAALTLPRIDAAETAPCRRSRQTAQALGVAGTEHAALSGCDYGTWTGRTVDDVGTTDAAGLSDWLTDPDFRGHGGESHRDLLARVGRWLDGRTDPPRVVLAVADAAVVRAAVVHALGAPARSIWRIDVPPLSITLLAGQPGQWSLRSLQPHS